MVDSSAWCASLAQPGTQLLPLALSQYKAPVSPLNPETPPAKDPPAPPVTVEELALRLQPGARLLGLDVGTKTIGLALSDVSRSVATAHSTIRRTRFGTDATLLLAIAETHAVGGLVIGFPINLDGSEGPRAQSTRAFARNLSRLTALPIALWDERLSTAAAERVLIAADLSRRKRALVIDQAAAAYILQGALDRMRHLRQSGP